MASNVLETDSHSEVDPYKQYERAPDVLLKEALSIKDVKEEGTIFEITSEAPAYVEAKEEEFVTRMDPREFVETLEDGGIDYDGSSPFDTLAEMMTKVTLDGGVLKRVITPGLGVHPHDRAIVRVHYNAFTEYSDEPFDSSRLRGQVCRFNLAAGDQLPGLALAVHSMKKGEKSQFLIKPLYAYGQMGCPPRVPPDSTILFNVELLSFMDPNVVDEYYSTKPEERKKWVLTDFMKMIAELRKVAKECFQENQDSGHRRALQKYIKISELLEGYLLKDDEEERVLNKELVAIYLNVSLCAVKLRDGKRAVTFARKALEIEPRNSKGLCRRAQGYSLLGDTQKAIQLFKKAQVIEPNNTWITQQLAKIDKDLSRWKAVETDFCRRMFSDLAPATRDDAVDKVPESIKREYIDLLKMVAEDTAEQDVCIPAQALSQDEINGYKAAGRELGYTVVVQGVAPRVTLRISKQDV